MKTKLALTGLLAGLVVFASSARATTIRGGSSYGTQSAFSDCLSGNVSDACEAVDTTPTVVTFNGINYDVFQFVVGNSGIPGEVFDVIDIGSIAASTTFSLPSIFDPSSTQVFTCNNQLTPTSGNSLTLFDSSGNPMAGPCTQFLTGTDATITTNPNGTFTTDSGFNVFNLVLDDPAPVSAPEPASLALLSIGLLGLALKFRYDRRAASAR